MFTTVRESFAVVKFFTFVTALTFLSIAGFTTRDCAYAIGFNLTSFRTDRDRSLDSSTQSIIKSDNLFPLSTRNSIRSLEEILVSTIEDFTPPPPNNIYVFKNTKLLSVTSGDVLTLKYDFTKSANDDSLVTIGTKNFPLANATDNDIHLYAFTPTDRENSDVSSLGIDDSTSSSTLDITNVQLPTYNFEISSALLFFGGLFFGKRYLRNLKERNTADKIKPQSHIRNKTKEN
jgi:hypothetical protein